MAKISQGGTFNYNDVSFYIQSVEPSGEDLRVVLVPYGTGDPQTLMVTSDGTVIDQVVTTSSAPVVLDPLPAAPASEDPAF